MLDNHAMASNIPTPNSPDAQFEELWQKRPVRIGRGTGRDVYELDGHADKVLKVSTLPSNVANWTEVVAYTFSNDKTFFGEVYSWSMSGRFLVMEHLEDVDPQHLSGLEIPWFVNDKKTSALGRARDGSIKLRDYGMLAIDPGVLFRFPAA